MRQPTDYWTVVLHCLARLQPRLPVYISLDTLWLILLQLHSSCCHFVLNICFYTGGFEGEAIDWLLSPVWLRPLVFGEWLIQVLLLLSSILVKDKGLESAFRREELSASLFQISQGVLKEGGSPEW